MITGSETCAGECWMSLALAKALERLMAEVASERTSRLVTVPLPLKMAEEDARGLLAAFRLLPD